MVVVLILAVLTGGAIGALGARRFLSGLARAATEKHLARTKQAESAEILAVARRQSNAVLLGQACESVVPLLAAFPYDASDARFLGRPIDYIIFDGYSEVRAGLREQLREIVFLDVKTGAASLNLVERRIRDCVEAGRVACESVVLSES